MKKIVLMIMVLIIIGVNIYPRISSRIEGVIVDKDSGEPIRGVRVELFKCNFREGLCKDCCVSAGGRETDKNGYFKFDDLDKAEYFMFAVRKDYLPYGSMDRAALDYARGGVKYEYLGEYPRGLNLSPFFKNKDPKRTFILKEGEIKHFKIKLEKAALLEVDLKVKTRDGIRDVNNFDRAGFRLKGFYSQYIEESPYSSRCLKAYGEVEVYSVMKGFFQQKVGKINLQKGVKSKIEYTFDFTRGPLIHGVVTVENNNVKRFGSITILNKTTNEFLPKGFIKSKYLGNTKFIKEFWFGGLYPGEYIVEIGYIHNTNNEPVAKFIKKSVTIISNEIIELSFNL